MMYKLDALDTFTFRTANPFDAGVNFHSSCEFPPSPAIYAGALREDVKQKNIKIGFNGLLLDGKYAFPRPLDLALRSDVMETMRLEKATVSSHQLDYMLMPKGEPDKKKTASSNLYIELDEMKNYLAGIDKLPYLQLDDFLTRETHTGIAMDKQTHSTVKGMWYTQESIRPSRGNHTCSLVAEGEGFQLADHSIVRVGGNQKLASVTAIEPFRIESNLHTRYFKLYFATPAIFKHGWLPKWINPETKEGGFSFKKKRVKFRLIAAAVGKPVPIGGYSHKGPRPLHLAVPAGSVYYFELLEGEAETVASLFHQKCISDFRAGLGFDYKRFDRSTYCDRGFGFVFAGNVEEEMINGK